MDTFAEKVQLQLSKSQNCDPKPAAQGHPESYSTLAKNRQGRPESRLDLGPRMLEMFLWLQGTLRNELETPSVVRLSGRAKMPCAALSQSLRCYA